jgi:hypothetical protein
MSAKPKRVQQISGKRLETLLARHDIQLGDRRLRQIAGEGFFPEPDRGEYQLTPTLLGLVRYYRELQQKRGGEFEAQELRKLTESADKLALENEKTRGGLVEIEAVYKHFQGLFIALRARILGSNLTDEEKDQLLNDLRGLKARDIAEPVRPRDDPQSPPGDPQAAPAA